MVSRALRTYELSYDDNNLYTKGRERTSDDTRLPATTYYAKGNEVTKTAIATGAALTDYPDDKSIAYEYDVFGLLNDEEARSVAARRQPKKGPDTS